MKEIKVDLVQNKKVFIIPMVVFFFFIILICAFSGEFGFIIGFSFLVMFVIILIISAYHVMFSKVGISDNSFNMYFWGFKYRSVDRSKQIFYYRFDAMPTGFEGRRSYVILSNRPITELDNDFKVQPLKFIQKENRMYLVYYVQRCFGCVIIPFNGKTSPYLDFDNWTCCGMSLGSKK